MDPNSGVIKRVVGLGGDFVRKGVEGDGGDVGVGVKRGGEMIQVCLFVCFLGCVLSRRVLY